MLDALRSLLRTEVADGYEHRARSCLSCTTPGACCLDEHFVNVRITRLEAVSIIKAVKALPDHLMRKVHVRTLAAIEKYGLDDIAHEKFACPLYEAGTGCLVHDTAKPMPCIVHACYDRREDLPPDELLETAAKAAARLDRRVYSRASVQLPLPVAIQRAY